MTSTEFKKWNQKAETGEVSDDLNPAFLFSTTHNEMLVKIAAGEFDLQALAKIILDARGFNENGDWVGFR